MRNKKTISAILFFAGFLIGWAYTFWLPETLVRNADNQAFGDVAYIYKGLFMSIPMIIGGTIIGIVDSLFTDNLNNKLLYAIWLGAWSTIYPLFVNYLIHPYPGAWMYAFTGIGVSVITVCIVYMLKGYTKAKSANR